MEQGPSDGGAHVQAEHPGNAVGAERHKQGVVQRGHRAMVLPPAHHPNLLGVQQLTGQLYKLPFPQPALYMVHWNPSFPPLQGRCVFCPHHTRFRRKCHLKNITNFLPGFSGSVLSLLPQIYRNTAPPGPGGPGRGAFGWRCPSRSPGRTPRRR